MAELEAAHKMAAKLVGKRGCDLARADFVRPAENCEVDPSGYTGRKVEVGLFTSGATVRPEGWRESTGKDGRKRYLICMGVLGSRGTF